MSQTLRMLRACVYGVLATAAASGCNQPAVFDVQPPDLALVDFAIPEFPDPAFGPKARMAPLKPSISLQRRCTATAFERGFPSWTRKAERSESASTTSAPSPCRL